MIVVCAPVRDNDSAPMITRVRNAEGASFELRLQSPGDVDSIVPEIVHYIVAERGVHEIDGLRFEAARFTSTGTDHLNDCSQYSTRAYGQGYAAPVIIGQVMTYEDERRSSFWTSGADRRDAPDAGTLRIGKHVGEDPQTTREDETSGYIVFDATTGTLDGVRFEADVTPRVITDRPRHHSFDRSFTAGEENVVVATISSMNGGQGGFALLEGPPENARVRLAIDEDRIRDIDEHIEEHVAYIAFDGPGGVSRE